MPVAALQGCTCCIGSPVLCQKAGAPAEFRRALPPEPHQVVHGMQASRDGLPSCVAPRRHSGGVCREDSMVRIALEAPSEDGSGILASDPSGSLYVDASSPSATARQHCMRSFFPQAVPCRGAPCLNLCLLHLVPVLPRRSPLTLLQSKAQCIVLRLPVEVLSWSPDV